MWQLILTIAITANGGVAVQSVSGFNSLLACQAAATAWKTDIDSQNMVPSEKPEGTFSRPRLRSAICVENVVSKIPSRL